MIPITYGNYQPEQLREGADDDVFSCVSEVISDHGEVDTYRGVATLCIKALCQVLTAWLIGILKPVPEELP